jgi:hypothetical protein
LSIASGQGRRAGWVLVAVGLALLAGLSFHLALNRIYQVDEAQNAFTARMIGVGHTRDYLLQPSLFLLGPLSWVVARLGSSVALFTALRCVFFAVFWLNLALMVRAMGLRLRSAAGMAVLMAAATLAPLWDYGFEIRHDNALLTGILLLWIAGRPRAGHAGTYALLGLLCALMQFTAPKAIVYWGPICAALLAFPHPGIRGSRPRLILAFAAGLTAGAGLAILAHVAAGTWPVYLDSLRHFDKGWNQRLWPLAATLGRLPGQTPLLVAGVAALVFTGAAQWRSMKTAYFRWDTSFPDLALLAWTVAVLFITPTPFPYNLVLLVPFAFLAMRHLARPAGEALRAKPARVPLAAAVVITHLVPFAMQTSRHFSMTNERQHTLMNAAEALTAPDDRLFDGAGLVPTRDSIGPYWFLHSLLLRLYFSGGIPSYREMLAAHPAPVLLRSYRTDWLTPADQAFIRAHYCPLADDLWVLGQVLPKGGGSWTSLRRGRYVALLASGPPGPATVEIDGARVRTGDPVVLSEGKHAVVAAAEASPAVLWLGPRLDALPALENADHRQLFVNWY